MSDKAEDQWPPGEAENLTRLEEIRPFVLPILSAVASERAFAGNRADFRNETLGYENANFPSWTRGFEPRLLAPSESIAEAKFGSVAHYRINATT